MPKVRLIARLDVKGPNLVKGIHLEGLRKLGDPQAFARRYYKAGIDEIFYIDIVASLYDRNSLLDIVERTTADVFIPITVGGGIRSVEDTAQALRAGADKVAINTAAVKRPELISEIANRFGSQCLVLSIEAKRRGTGAGSGWEVYYDNGREHTGWEVVDWARRACQLGAGEILVTSVDREGTGKGFDLPLVEQLSRAVPLPVIAGGGMGEIGHLEAVVKQGGADAVAMAHVLHYDKLSVDQIRQGALARGVAVRRVVA
jgi:imidazole glycerol-phosphate synthase subunit HisF